MKTVTVNLDNDMIELIDGIIQLEIFPNRSECIRAAIRNLLLFQQKLKVSNRNKNQILLPCSFRNEIIHYLEDKIIMEDQMT